MSLLAEIEKCIQGFDSNLESSGLEFWKTLGYQSERVNDGTFPSDPTAFWSVINQTGNLIVANASLDEWRKVHFLFQLTDDDLKLSGSRQGSLLTEGNSYQKGELDSFLFIAVELAPKEYSRTQLARITREVNRAFQMPVIILFQHGESLSVAVIDRRRNKRDSNKDVIDGRLVSIIKDVSLSDPHPAHVRILADLALPNVGAKKTPDTFRDLYEAWLKALSVRELNKRFYKELANWYFWAIGEVRFPDGGGSDPKQRNATGVIRLITRIVFIWFLKERKLVPEALFNAERVNGLLTDNKPDSSTYYKAILQNLFFATLNTELQSRSWAANRSAVISDEYLNPHAFRYEEHFKDKQEAFSFFNNVPFLNGGLFECLDRLVTDDELAELPKLRELITVEKSKVRSYNVQRIDGFSRRPENPIHVPNYLFFQEEAVKVDRLNEIYDTSGKDYRVRGLFEILNSYKFTVDENTPVEEEVALDPELLGKVFENLLASYNPETNTTARKQTGSFYTPREIVEYMVDESLHRYFVDDLEKAGLTGHDRDVRVLLSYDSQFPEMSEEVRTRLISAVDQIKILDPACGSGAFPMGILQKLVHFIERVDPKNERFFKVNMERLAELRKATAQVIGAESNQEILESIDNEAAVLRNAYERDELNYLRKVVLIRNSIFGVDIQPIAVQISKLRVFISLLVSERIDLTDRDNNYGVQPLPNLESKFVAANTLVKIDPPEQHTLGMTDDRVEAIKSKLKEVRESKFFPKNFAAKKKLVERDRALRKQLKEALTEIGFGIQSASLIAQWDPDQQNATAGFFDSEWMFLEKDGFSIVIGNPPYMRVQGLQQTQPEFMSYYRDHYKSASGSFDIYGLFVERGLQLMSSAGQLVYILPHKFFQAAFAVPLRKTLNDGSHLRQIVRFGAEQVFDEATTYTCLLFLAAEPQSSFNLVEVQSLENGRNTFAAIQNGGQYACVSVSNLEMPVTTEWDFTEAASGDVLQRLKACPFVLGGEPKDPKVVCRKIFVGLQTSADKLYVLELVERQGDLCRVRSKHTEQTHLLETALLKPFLMGKDVHRYDQPKPKHVVLFPYDISGARPALLGKSIISTKYPLAWKYLLSVQDVLEERENGRFEKTWWQYSRPQNLNEFEFVKLMTPEIAARCEFTVDSSGDLYHTTKVYSLALKEEWKAKAMYLLGILNSKVLWFFIKQTGYVLRGGFYTFKTDYLKPFPVPESDWEREQIIEALVKVVLQCRRLADSKQSSGSEFRLASAFFESLIDAIVYELYFPNEFSEPQKSISHLLSVTKVNVDYISLREDLRVAMTKDPTASGVLRVLGDLPEPVVLMSLFHEIYHPTHPIRQLRASLDSIDVVRVIEEASK